MDTTLHAVGTTVFSRMCARRFGVSPLVQIPVPPAPAIVHRDVTPEIVKPAPPPAVPSFAALPPNVPRTWPLFRLGQREFGLAAWELAPAINDHELAELGFKLAGPARDANVLRRDDQHELAHLLTMTRKRQEPGQIAREHVLLGQCGYRHWVAFLDLDVNDDAPGFDGKAAAATGARYRAALAIAFPAVGLGKPTWSRTNQRGGAHADVLAPYELCSVDLFAAVGQLCRQAARAAGVPLLTELPARRTDRPAVYLDDTVFTRRPESRGIQWRLPNACKPGGYPKTACTLAPDGKLFADPRGYTVPGPISRVALEGPLAEIQAARVARERVAPKPETPARKRARRSAASLIWDGVTGVMRHVDDAVRAALPGSGSRHDYRLVLAAWLLQNGVPADLAAATLASSTGDAEDAHKAVVSSKFMIDAGLPVRSISKLDRDTQTNLREALRREKRGQAYKGLPNPRERALLKAAAAHATDPVAAKALLRASWCGLFSTRATCRSCDGEVSRTKLVSERSPCPHCSWARARDLLGYFAEQWPERIYVAVMKLEDKSLAAAKDWKRATIKRTSKPNDDPDYNGRWLLAPGFVAFVATGREHFGHPWSSAWREDLCPARFYDLDEGLELLRPVMEARAKQARALLDAGDAVALGRNDWNGCAFTTSTRGVATNRLLPWPSRGELRERAKREAELRRERRALEAGLAPEDVKPTHDPDTGERLSPCCGDRCSYELRDQHDHVVAESYEHGFSFSQAVKACVKDAPLFAIHAPPD